ncbi:MAG: PorT family protein [Chitinophagales bacterium]|nr:PorT family protein [Chitinophagales bacterium]
MKKSLMILPFVFGILLTFSANAQLGIKAGINMAKIQIDPESSTNSTSLKPGLSIGAFYNMRLSDQFALMPEVVYIQHGTKDEYKSGIDKSTSKTSINYIQIPVLLKMRLVNSLYAQAGPYLGKGIGTPQVVITDASGNETTLKSEFTDNGVDGPNHWDYGFQAGAGFAISARARVDARYIHGLNHVTELRNFKTYNRSFNLNLSFFF